jgi:AraC-like DNA-binding protein
VAAITFEGIDVQYKSAHIQDINKHTIARSSRSFGWENLNIEHRVEPFADTTNVPQGVVEYGVFYFPLAGVGTFTVDGRTEKSAYASDSFCLFPPGVPLRWDRTNSTELTLISMSTQKVAEVCHHLGRRIQDIGISLKPSGNGVLAPLLATLSGIVKNAELMPPAVVVDHIQDAFVGQLLSLNFCADAKKVVTYRVSAQRLQQAIDFMMDHLADDINLAQIAQAAFMSKYHFARAFSSAFGVSPARWLTNARLNYASLLLKNTRSVQSIESVARCAGYASVSSFDRAFKRYRGISPLQFRHISK